MSLGNIKNILEINFEFDLKPSFLFDIYKTIKKKSYISLEQIKYVQQMDIGTLFYYVYKTPPELLSRMNLDRHRILHT